MYMAQQENDVHNYHVFIKQMIESGIPEKQAKCLIDIQIKFLNANVATKADIEDLRQELKSDIKDLRQETKNLRQELKSDIKDLRQETKNLRQELKSDIKDLRQETKDLCQELKSDIKDLRQETKDLCQELKSDIKDLRQELKSDIEVLRLSILVEFEKVRKEIVEANNRTIMWMVSTNVVIGLGIAGLIIAAIKYL